VLIALVFGCLPVMAETKKDASKQTAEAQQKTEEGKEKAAAEKTTEEKSEASEPLTVVDYCLYEGSYTGPNGTVKAYRYRLPKIEGKTEDIKKANKEIEELAKEYVEPELENMEKKEEILGSFCDYTVGSRGNITSVYVRMDTETDEDMHYVWNFRNDGSKAENADVFKEFSLNGKEFVKRAKEQAALHVADYLDENNSKTIQKDLKECYDKTLEGCTEKMPVFINESNMLSMVLGVHTVAGAQYIEDALELASVKKDVIKESILSPEKTDKKLPNVLVIATGGTIAGVGEAGKSVGYTAGQIGASPELFTKALTGIEKVANIYTYQFCNIASDDLTVREWIDLANLINMLAQEETYDGFVITHGTDTIEETAYFLNLTVKTEKPVVITGAMRPATAISADGSMNLYESIALAASTQAKGKEVLLVFADKIYGARDVTKINTHITDAFDSRGFGCIGYMQDSKPIISYQSMKLSKLQSEFDVSELTSLPKVEIAYFSLDADAGVLDYYKNSGAKGIVIAGAGDGCYSEPWRTKTAEMGKDGYPIVRSSRTGSGDVSADEENFANSISAGSLNPQKARILLMLALTKTDDPEKIQEYFETY